MVIQISIIMKRVDTNEKNLLQNFDRDDSFLIKLFYQVDRYLQHFSQAAVMDQT